jgi:F-type H+-transporting ATPase subunit b
MNINLTLLFQVLFFALFVWFSGRYVWTPIIGALNARKVGIADGLAAAEKGRQAEQQGRQKAEQVIAQAKTTAAKIVSQAEKRGATIVADAKQTARTESDRIIKAAHGEIDTEVGKAKHRLREQVGELAIAGAEQILGKEVDAGAHAELLDGIAAKLT